MATWFVEKNIIVLSLSSYRYHWLMAKQKIGTENLIWASLVKLGQQGIII